MAVYDDMITWDQQQQRREEEEEAEADTLTEEDPENGVIVLQRSNHVDGHGQRIFCPTCCALIVILCVCVVVIVNTRPSSKYGDPPRPSNDSCLNAVMLPTNGTVVRGTFHGSTHDPEAITGYCGSSSSWDPNRNIGIWYTFIGPPSRNGSSLRELLEVRAPRIALYTGSCEDGFVSVMEEDYEGCATDVFHFNAEADVVYYLYVASCRSPKYCQYFFDVSVEAQR